MHIDQGIEEFYAQHGVQQLQEVVDRKYQTFRKVLATAYKIVVPGCTQSARLRSLDQGSGEQNGCSWVLIWGLTWVQSSFDAQMWQKWVSLGAEVDANMCHIDN